MLSGWLKQYLPRSLYARAALILVVPIVVLQLVVSIAFTRNHLEDIITQKTYTMVRVLQVLGAQTQDADDQVVALDQIEPMLRALQMQAGFVDPAMVPDADSIPMFDFSGALVRDLIRADMPATQAILFHDGGAVDLYVQTDLGPVHIAFHRSLVTVSAPHQLLVTMVGFGILMTVIAFVYMRNQLRPIKKLAEAAQAYGRGHNKPYTPKGALEVRAAGSAFLDMRARIDRQIDQRTMMLSGVSHDLRTPLTRLRLGLAMLDEDEAAPMIRDVDEMQQMLDAFLEFSRGSAESGRPETVDPADLVRVIVEDAQRAGTPVRLGQVSGEGSMMLRPVALRRAVENLISNAVRYGSRAELSLALTDRSLRIRVEDDGPGIPSELRAEAQKPFERLDPSRNQNAGGGVGLGLAIVSDFARAHGGVLRLGDSESLGGLRADIVIGR